MKLLKETLLTKNDFAESVFSSSSDFYWLHAKGFESLNAFDSSTQCDCVCFFLYIYICLILEKGTYLRIQTIG